MRRRLASMLRSSAGRLAVALCGVLALAAPPAAAASPEAAQAVGIQRSSFIAPGDGGRIIALTMVYPAAVAPGTGRPFAMPFFTGLDLTADAPLAPGGKRPLIVFSHGRGSNALVYAWFAEALARHGYIVAAIDHYRANTYDATIAYLANKIWQRPLDLRNTIDFVLAVPAWSEAIDAERIGVAGHSQGGFTALWIGGARVNAEGFLAFQQGWKNNKLVPEHLRRELPLDPGPALDVADPRVKAVVAMAPGIVQAFGMDATGLGHLAVPAYITVGARDTQTPPEPNAVFAARHAPHAELAVIPGDVDHEIFVNECDQEGRDEFPEACIDAPGVDRHAIHLDVARDVIRFFDATLAGR